MGMETVVTIEKRFVLFSFSLYCSLFVKIKKILKNWVEFHNRKIMRDACLSLSLLSINLLLCTVRAKKKKIAMHQSRNWSL